MRGFDPHRPYQPTFFPTAAWRFVEAAKRGNKSLTGGTYGSGYPSLIGSCAV